MSRDSLSHYGHDTHGALLRGYARRCQEAVRIAVLEAAGWSRPYDQHKASPRSRIGLPLGELLLEGRRLGLTEDEISALLDRQRADPGRFGDPGRSRDLALKREPQRLSEDPSGGVDWAAYDAYVDDLRESDAKRLLKTEARLRVSAQHEANIS